MRRAILTVTAVLAAGVSAAAQDSFVNWESPQVHPLALTPDGSHLLAVNTADNRLEVFSVTAGGLTHLGAVPVGLDPVSVRARSATEAWVVNHISDSISIVDLATLNVVQTIDTGDEPTDVVFAGAPQRAFVSISQRNELQVYDPGNPLAAPIVLAVEGEDPRALASDGTTVYAAIFESGNNTTILDQGTVSGAANPYPGDPNPPPNSGGTFDPPIGAIPAPPAVGLITRKSGGNWLDDNGGNWSTAVTWDLHDHDVAVIDANSLAVSYVSGLMNANMSLAVDPGGAVTVVGTDAINHIRFEPNVNGVFVRVLAARFPAGGGPPTTIDLNPHLDYSTATLPQSTRDLSIGDPRGIVWDGSGQGYISGMGSNNVVIVDPTLSRVGLVEVGQGPTGVVVDEALDLVYVLNRFDATISRISTVAAVELDRVGFYDPTPAAITQGRPHLYDTHSTSGLGQAACASCHIDGRMDQLAWDLGDPSGAVKDFNQLCNGGIPIGGSCEDWHPMKGPMTTQTLFGLSSTEPFHWRGDREDLAAFNGAFISLMGDDAVLTVDEMDEFLAFVETLTPPPNPFRNMDGSLPSTFSNGGNPANGATLYNTVGFDGGLITCNQCHALPTGTNGSIISGNLLQETQSFKIPQLRNMHEKTGFDTASANNNRGFGFLHDGSVESLFEFLHAPVFVFASDQQRRDVEAFMMCLATDTHAAVGIQSTVTDGAAAGVHQLNLIQQMRLLANSGTVALVVKGLQGGAPRGYAYLGSDQYQSDRAAELIDHDTLFESAVPGSELTFTVVPAGSGIRIGIDRDEDGFFDGDEVDAGSDPADPASIPGDGCAGADIDDSGQVDAADLAVLLGAWGPNPGHTADLNGDGSVDAADLAQLLGQWGPC